MYLMRCLPPDLMEPFVDDFNKALFQVLQNWWGFTLSSTQQRQLVLPLRKGGFALGIHRGIARLAFFCGTLAAASDSQVNSSEVAAFLDPIRSLHQDLSLVCSDILADDNLENFVGGAPLQRDLCDVVYTADLNSLRITAPPRFASLVDFHGAHSWLLASPGQLDSWLANGPWVSACRLRLGAFPVTSGPCPLCSSANSYLDESGRHYFCCRSLAGLRTDLHHLCVDSVAQILKAAGLKVHSEPAGFRYRQVFKSQNTTDVARPDHFVWNFGVESQCGYLATDVTVCSSQGDVKHDMEKAAKTKVHNYRNNIYRSANGPLQAIPTSAIRFEPLVANSYGGWSKELDLIIEEASLICTARSGRFTDASRFRRWAWRKLSVAFQRASAKFFDRFLYCQLSTSIGPCSSGSSSARGYGSRSLSLPTAALDIQLLNLVDD